ncbi:hypothetical protein FQN57_001012 [Myotisia sp. PD_48]|nr:hypothetical protein FQN57_001012 [Myotisia sp. PD_48]
MALPNLRSQFNLRRSRNLYLFTDPVARFLVSSSPPHRLGLLLQPRCCYATSPKPAPVSPIISLNSPTAVPLKKPSQAAISNSRFRRFEWEISKLGGTPTCLYQAPGQRSYIVGAYSTATFCYAYAGYNFYTTSIDPLMRIGWYQELLFGGICFVMAIMGTVFFRRGFGLISQITAANTNGRTHLSIKVRRMLPFLKQRELLVTPAEVSVSKRIAVAERELTKEGFQESQNRLESQLKVDGSRFLQMPWKKVSLATWRIFQNARRLFTQENFVYVKIQGQKDTLRLDTQGAFSHEFHLLQKAVMEAA